MALKAQFKKYVLKFKSPAGTSRGILHEKTTWFLILSKDNIFGIGECSTIPGLSIDHVPEYESKIAEVCDLLNKGEDDLSFTLFKFPSIQFGLETALKDLETGGKRLLYPGQFTKGEMGIPINGLIWMGDKQFILNQIEEKIEAGYKVLKMKVGALDFDNELSVLASVRNKFAEKDLEIRLDANGAFSNKEVVEKLKILSDFSIHSIEQPIKPGEYEMMERLCICSPVPVAFDEELIGNFSKGDKLALLHKLSPPYIVVKPSLLGGIKSTIEWIEVAEKLKIQWWATSALESNIGLNAIAQWVGSIKPELVQGLGTGNLYQNNIPSPLKTENSGLFYDPRKEWNINAII